MSIFRSILNRIFQVNALEETASAAVPATGASGAPAQGTEVSADATRAATSAQNHPVDVEAVLTELARQKGGGGNWRTSIVDLLKLLDLESGLDARKDLAMELGVHAGADGTAEQNIALQKAVMAKLAENGGAVPESLRN